MLLLKADKYDSNMGLWVCYLYQIQAALSHFIEGS